MPKIIIAVLFLASTLSFAASEEKLVLFLNSEQPDARTATFIWDLSKHVCKVQRAEKKLSQALKEADCKDLDQFLKKNANELKELNAAGMNLEGRRKLQGEHLPLAQIEVNRLKLAILKSPPQDCDVHGGNCRPTSTLASDQLGFIVLRLLDKTE